MTGAAFAPAPPPPAPRPPAAKIRSAALLALTTSFAAIALAALRIYEETQQDVPRTAYVATALAVVAVGLLVGTFFGNGGALIGIGTVLAIALAVGSVVPNGRVGDQRPTPTSAADVRSTYRHGVGQLELDLTQVADPQRLAGRTITLDNGVGKTRVVVPDGLDVTFDAHVDAGEITVFGRRDEGTDISMTDRSRLDGTPLTIEIDQKVGPIEVVGR